MEKNNRKKAFAGKSPTRKSAVVRSLEHLRAKEGSPGKKSPKVSRWIILPVYAFILVFTLLIYLSSPVHAHPTINDPTIQPTLTPITWGTPTNFVTSTFDPLIPICTVPNATGSLFPTIIFPTGFMNTATLAPTGTVPSVTPSPTTTRAGQLNLSIGQSCGGSGVSFISNNVECVDELGTRYSPVGNSTNVSNGWADLECIGYMNYAHHSTASGGCTTNLVLNKDSGQQTVTVYYEWDAQDNSNSGYTTIYTPEGGYGSVSIGVSYYFSYKTQHNTDSAIENYWHYVYLRLRAGNNWATPMPTTTATAAGTTQPCQPLAGVSANNPIAEVPELTFRYGGCTTIMPGVYIPLGGLWGLPDLELPPLSLCIMWVTLTGSFMGIQLEFLITAFIGLGIGFAIFNEFRS